MKNNKFSISLIISLIINHILLNHNILLNLLITIINNIYGIAVKTASTFYGTILVSIIKNSHFNWRLFN